MADRLQDLAFRLERLGRGKATPGETTLEKLSLVAALRRLAKEAA